MKVHARFAYWDEGFEEIPPEASYLIMESDNPALVRHSNVSGETLLRHGVPLPVTPTYATWLGRGRPVFRGTHVEYLDGPVSVIENFFRPHV